MTTPRTAAGRAHVVHTVGMDVLDEVLAIEAEARAAALDPVTLAKALQVLADIDYPTDWANWLGGEGTAAAALAGMMAAEAVIAEYAAIDAQRERS